MKSEMYSIGAETGAENKDNPMTASMPIKNFSFYFLFVFFNSNINSFRHITPVYMPIAYLSRAIFSK